MPLLSLVFVLVPMLRTLFVVCDALMFLCLLLRLVLWRYQCKT